MVAFINRKWSVDTCNKDVDPGHSWPAVLPSDCGNPAGTGQLLTRVIVQQWLAVCSSWFLSTHVAFPSSAPPSPRTITHSSRFLLHQPYYSSPGPGDFYLVFSLNSLSTLSLHCTFCGLLFSVFILKAFPNRVSQSKWFNFQIYCVFWKSKA